MSVFVTLPSVRAGGMFCFLLFGLLMSVFVTLPSVRAGDKSTDQKLLEAIERALDRQLMDIKVGPTSDSEYKTYDCEGNQICKDCFDECGGKVKCASVCMLRDFEDEDKRGSDDTQKKGWWYT
ncbi:uncharacterized protein LOC128217424 isoform X2 [Mya arenaria]|nr:uncharacterized protein LOC128217424 isoform X2 [Mya arenaria]